LCPRGRPRHDLGGEGFGAIEEPQIGLMGDVVVV